MSMSTRNYLRPEALPARWSALSESQQRAYRHAVGVLAEACRNLSTIDLTAASGRPTEDRPYWLSTDRVSQILFLDGGRGTGKTTVLASLVTAECEPGRTTSAASITPGANGGQSGQDEKLHQNLMVLRQHAVWLEPLDMDTAPQTLNLLPAILARIEEAIHRLSDRSYRINNEPLRGRQRSGLLEGDDEAQEALMRLQRLQSRVAIGWESRLNARGSQLDPDTFALELTRSERARLTLNRHVRDLLDHLAASTLRTSAVPNPLFILPVDDLDLSPSLCLPVLSLLRAISVPRLFTVALGDLNIVDMACRLKVSSELASAQGSARAEGSAVSAIELNKNASYLAANMLRKLVPVGQRVRLEPMDRVAALNLRPLDSGEDEVRLHGRLSECPLLLDALTAVTQQGAFLHDVKIETLRDFLMARLPYPEAGPAGRKAGSGRKALAVRREDSAAALTTPITASDLTDLPYSGLDALRIAPRQLTDLWIQLTQSVSQVPEDTAQAKWRTLVEILAEHCRVAVLNEPAFRPEQAESIISYLSSVRNGDSRRFPSPATAEWSQHGWESHNPSFVFRSQTLKSLYANRPADIPVEYLSEGTAGLLVLMHDLLRLGGLWNVLVHTPIDLPTLTRAADWKRNVNGVEILVSWPEIPAATFWEVELGMHTWRAVLRSKAPTGCVSETQSRELAFDWLAIGTAVVDSARDKAGEPILPPTPAAWSKRLQRLGETAEGRGVHAARARDWLAEIALWLMPEAGSPLSHTDVPLAGLNIWMQPSVRERVVSLRADRLRQIQHAGGVELAEQLRNAPLPPGFGDEYRPAANSSGPPP